MFNWLQHLFTVRAVQRELADALKSVIDLQAENSTLKQKLENAEARIAEMESQIKFRNQHSTGPFSALPDGHPIKIKRGW